MDSCFEGGSEVSSGELSSAGLPKDGLRIALCSLDPFSVPRLWHLNIAGGKGQSMDPDAHDAKLCKLDFKIKACIIFKSNLSP